MAFSFRYLNAMTNWFIAASIIATGCTIISGCAAPKKTTTNRIERVDTNAATITSLRSWLAARSILARNLSVDGDISVDQNGSSNSASFSMKSKRLADPPSSIAGDSPPRIDSLSVEVFGPFGIKVARFLASPVKYQFYDILHGEPLTGPTDTHSLEALTQLRGVSLSAMNDIIYGIAGSDLNSSDSLLLFSNGSTHMLVVRDMNADITEQLDLEGELPSDSSAGNLSLVEYLRWNRLLPVNFPMLSSQSPDVMVRFQSPIVVNGVSIPQHIMAAAGNNKLTLDYNHIEVNSPSMVVKIKMPQ
jgi:hypothetical protein